MPYGVPGGLSRGDFIHVPAALTPEQVDEARVLLPQDLQEPTPLAKQVLPRQRALEQPQRVGPPRLERYRARIRDQVERPGPRRAAPRRAAGPWALNLVTC